ncbi:transcription factor GTE9-like [Arachis stenosperma]|uniref:transcription factor GTE9-like n=1 Tax=Arachis stenosperma TaxID=217475 RepID=UPI0025AC0D04|nr:transcription factor GTE9-like [Arachis stenosperma]
MTDIEAVASLKRGAEGTECRKEKKQKMRRTMDLKASRQCSTILNVLSSHKHGWLFNQPVDPILFQIPDYFDIITHPMDLGTIKYKLESNSYPFMEDFVADVRLTFCNSMIYYPRGDEVYKIAMELSQIFEGKWEEFERSLKCEQDSGKSMNQENDTLSNNPPQKLEGICYTPTFIATFRMIPRGMHKERARIEAQTKAAEKESKRQENIEREIAIGLEKMKIIADEKDKRLKELEMLSPQSPGSKITPRLGQLSLFDKDYNNMTMF